MKTDNSPKRRAGTARPTNGTGRARCLYRAVGVLNVLLALIATLSVHADEPITNVMSSVVSYQYPEDFSSAVLTNGGAMSAMVSYQYLEWPGDDVLGLVSSRTASYFYGGTQMTVVVTNRVPTDSETTALNLFPRPTPSQLKAFDGALFTTNAVASLDPNRMTVVLTHGWNSSPNEWATNMAAWIRSGMATTPNIVAWDWSIVASNATDNPGTPAAQTQDQGAALAEALLVNLGPDYAQPIHFIGHSLGTLVNARAANYLHGDQLANEDVSPAPWAATNTQMTLFDEASYATGVYSQQFWTIMLKILKDQGNPLAPQPYYFHPMPVRCKWADNYITAFGFLHRDTVNVILTNKFPTTTRWWAPIWQAELTAFHGYPCDWYAATVEWEPSTPDLSAMGWRWSFEQGGHFDQAPATNTVYFQVGGSSSWNLIQTNWNDATLYLQSRASRYSASLTGAAREEAMYKTISGIAASGQVEANMVDGDYRNTLLRLVTSETASQTPQLVGIRAFASSSGSNTNTPAYAWISVSIPTNAISMSFDFKLLGDGASDTFVAALNGTNVFSLAANLIQTNFLMNSGLIDVSALAGQTTELFFGIVSGTSTNAQITVQDILFYSLQSPTAGFTATPTASVAPFVANFTDTSNGAITNWFWDFGDGNSTNMADVSVSHPYLVPGSNTVTLIVSGPTGSSTNTMLNLIWALSAYQGWQLQYFGCVDCPEAAENADPDGDGMSNLQEHLAGTTPTNAGSVFKVGQSARTADGFTILWQSVPGKTYKVLYADNPNGPWREDLPDSQITAGNEQTSLPYTDTTVGVATKRFYRVKLVVP